MRDEKYQLLLKTPGVFLYLGVQVIVPALPALLTDPAWKVLCNRRPLLRPLFLDKSQYKCILLNAPRTLYQVWVEHLLPPVEALHVSPTLEALSDLLPVPTSVLLHSYGQLLVLCLGPVALVCSILVLSGPSLVEIWIFPLASNNLLLLGHGEIVIAIRRSLL